MPVPLPVPLPNPLPQAGEGANESLREFHVKKGRNPFIERVLKRFGYAPHGRADKGVLLHYIKRITGLSRQQITRLVRQYRKDGKLSKATLHMTCSQFSGFNCVF